MTSHSGISLCDFPSFGKGLMVAHRRRLHTKARWVPFKKNLTLASNISKDERVDLSDTKWTPIGPAPTEPLNVGLGHSAREIKMNKLKIFISWSGDRSKAIATAFRDWLPMVLEGTEPFMSDVDIDKGAKWDAYISQQLAQTNFGIICLTPENRMSPAIHYEVGALSKSVERAQLWTYLYELSNADIKWPLSEFQHTTFEKEQTRKLLRSINAVLGEHKREDAVLNNVFDACWPYFETKLRDIPSPPEAAPQRSDRDILAEILELTRASRNEDETIRLLELHRASLGDRLSPVIEEYLDEIEKDPDFYQYDVLFRRIRKAIEAARMLLKGLQHPKVGDLKDFLESNFTDYDLARFIKKKVEPLILSAELSTRKKRRMINREIEAFESRVFDSFYRKLK